MEVLKQLVSICVDEKYSIECRVNLGDNNSHISPFNHGLPQDRDNMLIEVD